MDRSTDQSIEGGIPNPEDQGRQRRRHGPSMERGMLCRIVSHPERRRGPPVAASKRLCLRKTVFSLSRFSIGMKKRLTQSCRRESRLTHLELFRCPAFVACQSVEECAVTLLAAKIHTLSTSVISPTIRRRPLFIRTAVAREYGQSRCSLARNQTTEGTPPRATNEHRYVVDRTLHWLPFLRKFHMGFVASLLVLGTRAAAPSR